MANGPVKDFAPCFLGLNRVLIQSNRTAFHRISRLNVRAIDLHTSNSDLSSKAQVLP